MIGDHFEQAQLAQAAYALNLNQGMSGTSADSATYIASLKVAGMSQIQAEAFANEYTVIDQYNDNATGFSGTVFKDKAGNYHMAIRGTTDLTDWSENFANIGADGIAIDQGVSLYNWYQRLTSPAGSTVSQVTYHKEQTDIFGNITTPAGLESYTVELTPTEGGELLNATSITVAGHSLGGHLANIMSQFAPDIVSDVYTYNAPGFDTNAAFDWSIVPLPHPVLSQHPLTRQGYIDMFHGMEVNRYDQSVIGTASNPTSNFRIEGDLVSQIGYPLPGQTQTELFSESINGGFYDSHMMAPVVDALAIYDLLARVDDTLTVDDITGILSASSNIAGSSLESAVTALGELLHVSNTTFTGSEFDSNRDLLYTVYRDINLAIDAAYGANASAGLTIESFATTATDGTVTAKSATEIASLAQGDVAYRYALVNGNSFAVIGADYTAFNQNGGLDIYDPNTGQGQLSTNYLDDRADYLSTLLTYNINDDINSPNNTQYIDATTGSMNAESGAPDRVVIFGNDNSGNSVSELTGYDGNVDHIYGMGSDYGYTARRVA